MKKAKKESEKSPVMRLLGLTWFNGNIATSHSWRRYNTSLRKTLQLAIGSGFKFEASDFTGLVRFRPSYWMGADWEWVYSMAVAEGNESAAKAWETFQGREPIIADDVAPALRHGNRFAHQSNRRKRDRIHVGCGFKYQGFNVRVTSFVGNGPAFGVADEKNRRFSITRQSVIADRAAMKEKTQIHNRLFGKVKSGELKSNTVLDTLGVKSITEFYQIPIHILQSRAAEFGC